MIELVVERLPELWLRTGEHVVLTGAATLAAILLGVPAGIFAARHRRTGRFITGVVGILQTIPSLAMLAFLLAMLNRIGFLPAVIALTLYALLPIVRNTMTGITGLPPQIIEAANGMGMTARQRLRLVELPLALPVIVTGIRTAAVVGVGIATLSAFIGAGGLGQFINRGLSLSNHQLILLGAVPSALLALAVDATIGASSWALGARTRSPRTVRIAARLAPILLFALGVFAVLTPQLFSGRSVRSDAPVIRIGSKNFTEQLILGELLAQLIERETDMRVDRRFDLGGTTICHESLVAGGIDLYAEYTGTGLIAVLGTQDAIAAEAVYGLVEREYRERFDLHWLAPLGFNNTYAITVRAAVADENGWERISDLRPVAETLQAGWTSEFSERRDGYPGLRERYGINFGMVRDLDTALMYEAVRRDEVDVICAFATDGRIAAYDLRPLIDDLGFFPPYQAAPVVRGDVLARHPGLRDVLNGLADRLTDSVMRRLNHEVDATGRSPAVVAREFLAAVRLR